MTPGVTILDRRQFPVMTGAGSVAQGTLIVFKVADGRVLSVAVPNIAPSQAQIDAAIDERIKQAR